LVNQDQAETERGDIGLSFGTYVQGSKLTAVSKYFQEEIWLLMLVVFPEGLFNTGVFKRNHVCNMKFLISLVLGMDNYPERRSV
jgi:hypothetical protein